MSTIDFYTTESPGLDALPSTLRNLTLGETLLTTNPFQDRPYHFLETLRLGGGALNTAMTWNIVDLRNLHYLSLEGRSIQTLLSLLSHISVPRLEVLNLGPSLNDETSTAGASAILDSRSPIYRRLMKLKLRVFMNEQLPLVFECVNWLIDNSAPVLEQLHFSLQSDYTSNDREEDEPQNLIRATSIRTPQKVVLEREGSQIHVDNALSCLGEGTGMEELTIRGLAYRDAYNQLKSAFVFPHLKNLVLHGRHLHPLADHITGPLLTSVQLK